MNSSADPTKLANPIVAKIPRRTSEQWLLSDAAGDANQYDQITVEIIRPQCSIQVRTVAIERNQPVDFGRAIHQTGEGRGLRRGCAGRPFRRNTFRRKNRFRKTWRPRFECFGLYRLCVNYARPLKRRS